MLYNEYMLLDDIKLFFKGDVSNNEQTLLLYSKDASVFELKPELVASPLNVDDIRNLVDYINKNPKLNLSITPRAAGTCMSGGPLSESIVLDMTKHFINVIKVQDDYAITQPGVYYRDFDKETLKSGLILPCYTSSREINTVGGMVGNNSAGEKTLSYGQTERYVKRLKIIFSDGKEYEIKPLSKEELEQKIKHKDFEGQLYNRVYKLITENQEIIKKAKPTTSKNSAGYYLWNVWDGKTFDLNKLIVGSQGTLGVITEIEFQLVKPALYSETVVISLNDLGRLDQIVNEVLKFKPESFECFDDKTLRYAVKYKSEIIKDLKHSNMFGAYLNFLPEIWMSILGNFPALTFLAEFTGDDQKQVRKQCQQVTQALEQFNIKTKIIPTLQAEKFWIIRRQSFGLLRHHTTNMRTAPFVDDIIVHPENLPEFLPKLNAIFESYKDKMIYTLAGHIGDGNFHIIPLMDFKNEETQSIIADVSKKVFDLVFEYQGSMAAEHNDGLVRGPFLEQMYGEEVYQLFREVKDIFDPNRIFNPNKKVDATFKYSYDHLANS